MCIISKEYSHEPNNAIFYLMVVSKLLDRTCRSGRTGSAGHRWSVRDLFVDLATAKMGSQMYPMAPPGHEGVGYVSKVGAEVTGVKEGDRVAGGGFATVRNLSTERLYKIPESEKPDEY